MSIFAIALLFCGLFFNAHAHVCFYNPLQRGAQPTFQVGDENCYQRTGPCGGRPQGAPKGLYRVGQEAVVHFQQNFNHFNPDKPGYIDLSVSYDNDTTFKVVARRNDFPGFNMNTQSNLTFKFTPDFNPPPNGQQRATLRLRYVSYNPYEVDPQNNTDAIFYSCADIVVGNFDANEKKTPVEPKPVVVENAEIKGAPGCVTPPRWVATGETLYPQLDVYVKHRIWYDTVSGWIKWERTSDATAFNITDLWNLTATNYGSLQYAINANGAGSCEDVYADKFYPWQYGPKVGMYLIKNSTEYQMWAMRDVLGNTDLRIQWYVKAPKCLPSATVVEGATTAFEAKEVDSIDPSVFTVPAACKSNTVKRISCSKRP